MVYFRELSWPLFDTLQFRTWSSIVFPWGWRCILIPKSTSHSYGKRLAYWCEGWKIAWINWDSLPRLPRFSKRKFLDPISSTSYILPNTHYTKTKIRTEASMQIKLFTCSHSVWGAEMRWKIEHKVQPRSSDTVSHTARAVPLKKFPR